jgi:hypothetical protein
MPHNGKEVLPENEAAALFVIDLLRDVRLTWPSITAKLQELPGCDKLNPEDMDAAFEFALAVVAVQIQAIPSFYTTEQAARLRKLCVDGLCGPDLGTYPKETLEEYQSAWDHDTECVDFPVHGMASVLYDKLECSSTCHVGSVTYKDPILLMLLAECLVSTGGTRWKRLAQHYEIVP